MQKLARFMPHCILILLFFTANSAARVAAQTPYANASEAKIKTNNDNNTANKTANLQTIDPAAMRESVFKSSERRRNLTARVGINTAQTATLTLNEAIRRALENNNDIEVARQDVQRSETVLRSLEGFYQPVLTVTPTYTRNSNFRTESGNRSNDFTVNTSLMKRFQVGGGSLQPFFNNSQTNSFFGNQAANGQTTSFFTVPISNATLGANYAQPLFRNRSIDQQRRQIRIQRKRLAQSDADFRRTTIETIAAVQRAYWDLVFALRDQQNRVDNLNLTKENLRRVEAQIEAGSAAPLARAEVATELANRESDVLAAAEAVTRADNALKQLILKDAAALEWTTQLVPVDQPTFDQTPISLESALADAKANRPELQRLRLDREVNDIDLQFFRNQTKPRVDFNAGFSLNGFAQNLPANNFGTNTFPLIGGDPNSNSAAFLLQQLNATRAVLSGVAGNPILNPIVSPNINTNTTADSTVGGYTQALRNLFTRRAPIFSLGVTFELPLNNKTAKADLAGAKIERSQIEARTRKQEEIVIAEVRNAVQAVETARQRIQSATAARQNAEIQLQGEQKLYEVGRSTTFLLFQRENALANARNAEIRAQTDYNKALAELQRATSTTLRSNNIIIDSPVAP
jgi:outer membrane protein